MKKKSAKNKIGSQEYKKGLEMGARAGYDSAGRSRFGLPVLADYL